MVRGALAALTALTGRSLWAPRPAAADQNDLVMSRLATRITDDAGLRPARGVRSQPPRSSIHGNAVL